MAGGRGAVAEAAVGQAFEGVVGEFGEEDGMVEKGDIVAFDGEGEGFDEWGFGFGAGIEAADGQALLYEGVDIGFADGIGFSPDDLWTPFVDDVGEAIALELPADLVEALEGNHFSIAGIEDGDGGEVVVASPIDAGDIGVAGLWLAVGGGGGGVSDAAEDLALVVGEFGLVFGVPYDFGRAVFDAVQFSGVNEIGIGGAEMEGLPFGFLGIEAGAVAAPEPVASVGRAEEAGDAAGGGEHGTDDIVPDAGGHEGGFVEDGEIQAFAAEFIGIMGAADGDHAAFGQVNAAFSRAYYDAGEVFDAGFEVAPDLACHLVGGGDPPAAFVFHVRGFEDVDQPQLRFAPAPAAGQGLEACGVIEDFQLSGVGRSAGDGRGQI